MDEDLAVVTGRLEAAMKAAGQSVEQLMAGAADARAEIVATEFGYKGDSYDAGCFHAQQCVEKYLKAWLQESNIAFGKIYT
jgi:hypothetical protein